MPVTHVEEPGRSVSQAGDFDVIVCGSGPAGSAAAVTAARAGARTLLIEAGGCLGGVWTAGLLTWILDGAQKTGMMREILERIAGVTGDDPGGSRSFDPEAMKLLLETMCQEAGVTVRLHTRVCAGLADDSGRIRAIFTESKSGREAWAARVFIDCTGDGDLAAQLGATTELGHPETGLMQPMSMLCLLAGAPALDDKPYTIEPYGPRVKWLREEIQRGGHDPSYGNPSLFGIRDGLATLMANHEYGVDGTSAGDVTRATLEARREVHAIIDALRKAGPRWKDLQLVATPDQIGVRESRRIRGRYVLTCADLIRGARFPDAICRVYFPVDVHSLDPKKSKTLGDEGVKSKPYDVPLRSLIAAGFDNLLMAGRCISGDFFAHASYRVTGNAVAMGEAAGLLGAVSTRQACDPYQVSWDSYQPELARIRGGVIIPEPAVAG